MKSRKFALLIFALGLCVNVCCAPLVGYAAGGIFGAAVGYGLEELFDAIKFYSGDNVGEELIAIYEEEGWVYLEDYDVFVPGNWETAQEFIGYIMNDNKQIAQIALSEDLANLNEAVANAKAVSEENPLTIPGETFAQICERLALQYAPDAETEYVSWQDNNHVTSISRGLLWEYGEGFITNTSTVYFVPFARDSAGTLYFSPTLFRASVSDDTLTYDYIANTLVTTDIYDGANYTVEGTIDLSSMYAVTVSFFYQSNMWWYDSYERYLSDSQNSGHSADYAVNTYRLSSDVTQTKNFPYNDAIMTAPTDGELRDWGFYFSDKPIVMDGWVPDDIPAEDLAGTTVALTGDNPYEYTITTDDGTVVMGDWVENNYIYNYPAVPDDGSGDSSVTLPAVPDVQLDLDQYLAGVDDYVTTTEGFFQAVYKIIPKPIMDLIITSFGLLIVVGVIKIVFFMK